MFDEVNAYENSANFWPTLALAYRVRQKSGP